MTCGCMPPARTRTALFPLNPRRSLAATTATAAATAAATAHARPAHSQRALPPLDADCGLQQPPQAEREEGAEEGGGEEGDLSALAASSSSTSSSSTSRRRHRPLSTRAAHAASHTRRVSLADPTRIAKVRAAGGKEGGKRREEKIMARRRLCHLPLFGRSALTPSLGPPPPFPLFSPQDFADAVASAGSSPPSLAASEVRARGRRCRRRAGQGNGRGRPRPVSRQPTNNATEQMAAFLV